MLTGRIYICISAILFVLTTTLHGVDLPVNQDFQNGLGPWTSSGTESDTVGFSTISWDGTNKFGLLKNSSNSQVSRFFSPSIAVTAGQQITVKFRYRSNVQSAMHSGSWVCLAYNNGSVDGIMANFSPNWQAITQTITVPAGQTALSIQPRLQGQTGQFEIDDILIVVGDQPVMVPPNGILDLQDFQTGLGLWTNSGVTSLETEGSNIFGRMENTSTTTTARFFTPYIAVNGLTKITVTLRYRSSVSSSGMHNGSWLCLVFSTGGVEGLIADYSADWREISQTFLVPTGATNVKIQPRLQGQIGQFDIDDVSVKETPPSGLLTGQDFQDGFGSWTSSGTNSLSLVREGSNLFGRLTNTASQSTVFFSQLIELNDLPEIALQFKYRSNVTASSLNNGSWVGLKFFDAAGNYLGDSTGLVAIIAAYTSDTTWNEIVQTIQIPPTAAFAQIQQHLNAAGIFDIDEIIIAEIPPISGMPQPQTVTKQDFQSGIGLWVAQGVTSLLNEDINVFGRMTNTVINSTSRFNSPPFNLNGLQKIVVKFKYRSNVTSSSMHNGSWLYINFTDDSGIMKGENGMIADFSDNWVHVAQTISVPSGATKVRLQARVQGQLGQFDIDDITVQTAEFYTHESYTLSGQQLIGSSTSLTNQSSTGLPLSFILPDAYCNNEDYVYDLNVAFTTTWSGTTVDVHHCVFSLGMNIMGQEVNSLTIMLLNGNNLIVRVIPEELGTKSEIRVPITIIAGQERKIRVQVNANTMKIWLDGVNIGQLTGSKNFFWPLNIFFHLGSEGANSSLLGGSLTEFNLAVIEPKIRASFGGGRNFGYFVGNTSRNFSLSVLPGPDGIPVGLTSDSQISIRDLDNRQVGSVLMPVSKTSDAHNYVLPAYLSSGWFRLIATVNNLKTVVTIARPISILSSAPVREDAELSSYGITKEFKLYPASVDLTLFDDTMKRMSEMGIRWFRAWVSWDYVEETEGVYNWTGVDALFNAAALYGIEIYPTLLGGTQEFMVGPRTGWVSGIVAGFQPIIDMNAWKDFVGAFADRYQNSLHYYQIWNEADTKSYSDPLSPSGYLDFLSETAAVIKANDSDAKISLGGLCAAFEDYWFDKPFDPANNAWGAPAFWVLNPQTAYDFVDYHYYSVGESQQSWDLKYRMIVDRVRPFLQTQNESSKKLWNGEAAFCATANPLLVGKGGAVFSSVPMLTEKKQAIRVIQMHIQGRAANIERTILYSITGGLGVLNEDFSPKPAYTAHAILVNLLTNASYIEDANVTATNTFLRVYGFHKSQPTSIYSKILWMEAGTQTLSISSSADVYAVSILTGARKKLTENWLTISEEPVYLESTSTFSLYQ